MEEDGHTTLVQKRHAGALVMAELTPVDRLPAARQTEGLPSYVLGTAQKEFGDLVVRAALGQPQVLLRNTTPVAVLLPAGPLPPSDPPAAAGAADTGDAVSPSDPVGTPRRLATLGDVIGPALAAAPAAGPAFGLRALDNAVGRLQADRLTLVGAPPSVGGSLLGLAAARKSAPGDGRRVLYAASGPNRDDIFRRILSAETNGDYPRLKQGRLTASEQEFAQQLGQLPLSIDDGSDLTAEAIAETVPYMEDLALVVVDRLSPPTVPGCRCPATVFRLPPRSWPRWPALCMSLSWPWWTVATPRS
ncbi:DnaB-like helicase C-terminal domain-containing protein [Streptomyces sp. NPDC059629]|uniref:DnaB-like helicase C-terminal domain-containing protein n=1 Tax=Streptomyces sp. NPDC059629 TaxID=3346889 RepID=UPI0036C22349